MMSQSFDPIELVAWTSLWTSVIMLAWSAIAEGIEPWANFDSLGLLGSVGFTCICAAFLNTSGMFVMREMGPVAQQIIGNLKSILTCLGAVAAFGEVITAQQMIGFTLCVIGAFWYNNADMQVREEEKEASTNKLLGQAQAAQKA